MTIVNDDSRAVNKLEASLTDDTRVIIYNRQMFIVQATGLHQTLQRLSGYETSNSETLSLTGGGSKVVEHLTHAPMIEGLNPAVLSRER
jgi:hypothetical protein